MEEFSKNKAKRAQRIMEIATAMAEAADKQQKTYQISSRIQEITLHCDGYAEPGYSSETGIVATGNWNTIKTYNRETNEHIELSALPERISGIFEKMGIEIEWSDEWSTCMECSKLVRTSGDSYSWKPSYYMDDSGITCRECVKADPSSYLEYLTGNDSACETMGVDLSAHGYIQLNEDSYESGWHPGQTDQPSHVAKKLRDAGISDFIFKLDEASQFYSKWSVYILGEPAQCADCKDNAEHMDWSPEDKAWTCNMCGVSQVGVLPPIK